MKVKRNGKPAKGVKVELLTETGQLTTKGSSPSFPLQVFGYTDRTGHMQAQFSATKGSTLGMTTLTAIAHCRSGPNLIAMHDVRIVGPADDWDLRLNVTAVIAGESVEIAVKAADEIGQDVWDGSRVRFEASNGGKVEPRVALFRGGEAYALLLTGNEGICTIMATIEPIGEIITKQVEVWPRVPRA